MLFSRRRHQPLLRLTTRRNLNLLPGLNSWDHYSRGLPRAAEWGIVERLRQPQMPGLRADIGNLGKELPGQFPLDADIVVVRGGNVPVRGQTVDLRREKGARSGGDVRYIAVVQGGGSERRRIRGVVAGDAGAKGSDALVEHATARAEN